MENGIAILIKGDSADLQASLHAIELATRTTKVVHAVLFGMDEKSGDGNRDNRFRDPLLNAVWLGQARGVTVHCHTLTHASHEELLAFFRANRIFCLIIGAQSPPAERQEVQWVEELRRKLESDAHWYLHTFWVLVTKPWDNTAFERVVRQLPPRQPNQPDPPQTEAPGSGPAVGARRKEV